MTTLEQLAPMLAGSTQPQVVDYVGGLTPEDLKHLRRPFTEAAIYFRAKGKPGGKVLCLTYVDSRLVNERVTEVDPNFTTDYSFPAGTADDPLGVERHLPVCCRLTINGVSRIGVGQNDDGKQDDKHVKSAFSDSFKRAGVEFGIGGYLYAMPKLFIDESMYGSKGNAVYINKKGEAHLRQQYAKAINTRAFKERFGEPIDYGDMAFYGVLGDEPDQQVHSDPVPVDEPQERAQAQREPETQEVKQQTGKDTGSKGSKADLKAMIELLEDEPKKKTKAYLKKHYVWKEMSAGDCDDVRAWITENFTEAVPV